METNVKWLKVSSLRFDRQNPRLAEFDFPSDPTDEDFVALLWRTMDVRELVMSIRASGFFSHETLIVAEEHGEHVVIEGNRRLAAVKLLLDSNLAKKISANIPRVTPQEAAKLATKLARLPTVIDTREGAWRYLGFKHVNGPARWSSYAKSKYVAKIHHKYGYSLDDIAKQIGDTHKTVQRLYRGLMVIEQAEKAGVFERNNRWHRHFSFSHLYTGLQSRGISTFIGLRSEAEEERMPVPDDKIDELGELCIWMYGNKNEGVEPAIKRQNPDLRRLDSVVRREEALAALRSGRPLEEAFELSRPASGVFLETLVEAKLNLQKGRGLVTTGYDGSLEPIQTAAEVAEIAQDLYEEMGRRRGKGKKRRPY